MAKRKGFGVGLVTGKQYGKVKTQEDIARQLRRISLNAPTERRSAYNRMMTSASRRMNKNALDNTQGYQEALDKALPAGGFNANAMRKFDKMQTTFAERMLSNADYKASNGGRRMLSQTKQAQYARSRKAMGQNGG